MEADDDEYLDGRMPDGLFSGDIDECCRYGCVIPCNDDGSLAVWRVAGVGDAGCSVRISRIGLDAGDGCGMRSKSSQPGSESLPSHRLVAGSECGNGTSHGGDRLLLWR